MLPKLFVFTMVVTLTSCVIYVGATPNTDDEYWAESYAGHGLHGHDVDGDGYIDLVTSHHESGGELWFNYYQSQAGNFNQSQDLPKGLECKFGELDPGDPWYLAIASTNNSSPDDELEIFECNQVGPSYGLDNTQGMDESVDYISWGHVDDDGFLDLIATSYSSSRIIYIYLKSSSLELGLMTK